METMKAVEQYKGYTIMSNGDGYFQVWLPDGTNEAVAYSLESARGYCDRFERERGVLVTKATT